MGAKGPTDADEEGESMEKPKRAVKDASLKRLINNDQVDAHQLMPLKYTWAWEHYLNGNANHWTPNEVPMSEDIKQWKGNDLSGSERLLVQRVMGFFSTAEGMVANNLCLSVYKYVTVPEARQYILRQALEEAIHSHTMLYIIESLGLDEAETFGMYVERESIADKDEFVMELTSDILREDFETHTLSGKKTFIKNLVGFYVILEGIFFYGGFAAIESMRRNNKMRGMGQQFQYISRDETIHLNFGIDLINGIKQENPEAWDEEMKSWVIDKVKRAVELESAYNKDILPTGLVGFKSDQVDQYIQYIADRRLERIGLPKQYYATNPFPWMSESFDLVKEQNFFEGRVVDYQKSSSLSWDDDDF